MAERCLRIALATNPDHAESLCNLGLFFHQFKKFLFFRYNKNAWWIFGTSKKFVPNKC